MARLTRRDALGAVAGLAVAPFGASAWTAARAADPVKLGVALSLTGRFSDSAHYLRGGYEFWAAEINAKGGLGTRPVQLVIYDDESNPDTGRLLAERLINRDGVLAILGPYSSPITDAVAVPCERAQVPMIATMASDPSIWARRRLSWSFQAFPSSQYDHEAFLVVADKEQKSDRKLAIVYEESPFSVGAKDWAMEHAKQVGFEATAFGYTPGSQDFSSIVERIVASGAMVVSMGGYFQPAVALTRQMMDRGYNPNGYHFILAADDVTKDALGANAAGVFGRTAWEPTTRDPASSAFVAAYKEKLNELPTYHSAAAYSGGQLVAAAAQAKGLDKSALRDALATMQTNTLLGAYKVNERGQQEGYRYALAQWQSGQRKLVGGEGDAPALWPKPKWS
jgi:branched-chain amino acid transport system substrate-binding protein